MHFIDSLSLRTARVVESNLSNYSRIEAVLSKYKGKNDKLTKQDTIDILKYGCQAVYGELFKLIIILISSWLMNILVETLVVMLAFSATRVYAGGKHLYSSTKCLVFTSILLLSTGYLGSLLTRGFGHIDKIFVCIFFGIILEFLCTTEGFNKILDRLNKKV